jgi:hypothetical protein
MKKKKNCRNLFYKAKNFHLVYERNNNEEKIGICTHLKK